jgi:hypothetical protein
VYVSRSQYHGDALLPAAALHGLQEKLVAAVMKAPCGQLGLHVQSAGEAAVHWRGSPFMTEPGTQPSGTRLKLVGW